MADSRHLIPQARALYAQGLPIDDVAAACGVSASTIYRWKTDDVRDWEAAREDYRAHDPRAVMHSVEAVLADIAGRHDWAREQPNAYADAVHKLSTVRDRLRAEFGDLTTVMGVLSDFAAWAADEATDEQRAALLRLSEGYLDHLKRSYS